jgi:hypothetical protein
VDAYKNKFILWDSKYRYLYEIQDNQSQGRKDKVIYHNFLYKMETFFKLDNYYDIDRIMKYF